MFTQEELAEMAAFDAKIDTEFSWTREELAESHQRDREIYLDNLPNDKRKVAAQKKAYYEANREKVAAQQKAYREANRERYNAYMREYLRKRREGA